MNQSDDPFNRVPELVRRSLEQSVTGAKNFAAEIQGLISGKQKLDAEEAARLLREAPTQYAKLVANAWLSGYQAFLDLNQHYVEEMSVALGGKPRGESSLKHSRVELQGVLGSTVSANVMVDNHSTEPIEVHVSADELLDAMNRPTSTTPSVEPEVVALAVNESRPVKLSVELDPKALEPNQTYTSILTLRGQTVERLELRVTTQRPLEQKPKP